MKIDRIETYTSEDTTLSFVKVLCGDGSWGMGQIAPYNADISAAEKAGMKCIPHSANLSLVTVFSLHMMAAIQNPGKYIEYSIEHTPWTENLFWPKLEVIDGKVNVPDGPGWGVEINPEWLEKAAIQVSSLE